MSKAPSPGRGAAAARGTIFLDEVGEINSAVQARLLRVLQEKEIVPVGASSPVPVDVRVISATNADLELLVQKGLFRDDLYYRLNVIPIYIPPLHQRREDIPLLLNFLLRKINQEYGRNVKEISPEALALLCACQWPGNVRELENVLGRAVINMRPGDKVVKITHLPQLVSSPATPAAPVAQVVEGLGGGNTGLAEIHAAWEKALLRQVMGFTGGNRTRAAAEFGAQVVEPDDIFHQPVDIFTPCALGAVINEQTIGRLQCRVVAGAANNVLAEERHGDMLQQRGIVYVPDYVINAGGLSAGAIEEAIKEYLGTSKKHLVEVNLRAFAAHPLLNDL